MKGLLSEDEYAAARSSVLNAHYTSPTVIRAIYDAVEKMGFRNGNILEPSMGIGNFFGMLPDTMQDSRLYGVELDSVTGRIAQKLYPDANIKVAGFETTDRRDFYDLAVGNVPFGQYRVNDKAYNKLGFSIHNYFFAKAIDQVRPGGIVAFVSSRYTLDSKDSSARKHIAERADLLGAIRLPNTAFKANAGTEVVSDIIFLQKRDRPIDHEPDWVQLGKTEDGFAINSYFVDHPEMVLGELTSESTQYGREECTVRPIKGAVLVDQLAEAIQHIEGQFTEVEVETPDIADAENERHILPADPDVKNFSYTVVDGEVYYRENSVMTQVELSDTAKGRVTGMVELRQIVNELIDQQLNDYPDADIKATQEKLNTAYDAFSAKYGLLNDRKNGRLFEQDSSYYLLCSLENLDEQGRLKSKAAMFTKRTIRPECTVTNVDTPTEALAVSIGERGRVDLPYMAELLGTPGDYERITSELSGVIFKDPGADPTDPEAGWRMADEYLSGNVRAKLRMAQLAAETNPEFAVNVTALEKAQPKDLEASEIDVRLGATWLAPEIIQKFMAETFQIPYYLRHAVKVRYSPYTAEWRIEGKSAMGRGDIISSETYGTSRANAYKILEDTLNLKDVRIYDAIEDEEGKLKRILNKTDTMLAQQKQQVIKDAFANWIWKDPQRRIALVKQYNELFNSSRPREYDGSHIHLVGMNPEITLREHQRNAIAHVLYGGNTLLAHEVGAGKTFEMAASAMEAKRLGLCQKSLFVVPNHLTEQWASEFLHLYPNAKLLVARKKDFETANRKKFCARIATGDYDAVIIGHSQFERIPLSYERQERIIQEQIDETLAAIEELKANAGENFSIKQMEKTRKTLETKLEKLRSDARKDDVITFEQLGVDRLFVDESHFYKNLFLTTKMRNVAGLSTSEAQKSSDMFGKCRYLDEITGGRGVVFATGTPVSNSMSELYTVMRYLQYGTLQQKGLTHFDCWASTFGETTTAIELAPEGTGYRARTRFAKFFNLPELMSMFKEVADIKTSDQLHLPVPDAKFETVVAKPSEIQKEMVQELSKRAAKIHSGAVDAFIIATHTDREHIHNHIIYNSTALDSTRKFRDFLLSGLAVQRLSDLICLEHQLSVIEIKPYRERQKRTLYPPRESNRDKLCAVIDNILLSEKPASFEGFLQKLEQRGYEIKRGKYTSVKGTRQKRFIRFRTLGAGYSEDEIKAVIAGDAEHCPHQKQPPKEKPFNLLVDVQAKLAEGKNIGYARWAKKYNLKEMSKTLIFLQEKKIGSIEEMQERVDAATARYHELGDSIKAAETRMTEIAVLRTHIVNYTKTRPVYDAYRKAGYSKRFLENHRAEITLHKAAKTAFDEAKLKKLPKVKELDAEYSKLLTEKKAAYPDYRKAKDEMQELLRAQRNVELFFAEEKNTTEKTQSR